MDVSEDFTVPAGSGSAAGEGLFVGTFSLGLTPSNAFRRSMRRKMDARETGAASGVARVEIGNEAAALREALVSHQQTVQKLQAELEEEQNASSSAAQEAMSMIVRLQHEKAEAIMESRQFKRLTEEKMTHDQQEVASLEDLLFKREQAMQALSCEVQAYRHRLLSYGFSLDGDAPPSEPQTPDTVTSSFAIPSIEFPQEYPPIRCVSDAGAELDKYPPGATPRGHLQKLEQRIFQLERTPSSMCGSINEKGVIVGHSPRVRPRHLRNISYGSYGSVLEFNKAEEFPASIDAASDYDDMSDRVYTVDAVHGASDDYVSTPRELQNRKFRMGSRVEEVEISKLQMRLQALEADRESMRQTLISMGTDKMQRVILKEIAEQMCKEGPAGDRIVDKPSSNKSSLVATIKSAISYLVFWRKKPSRIRYPFGITAGTVGLLLLLDKSSRVRQKRLLTKTRLTTAVIQLDIDGFDVGNYSEAIWER
ncbi:myosin-binding protein 7-like [Zingiber officinale]|uniref:GTD-binding domain-containing protein n=1 Tax=Zingiber officinale TaxID=94328 RepID=A0A8J5GID9_ZINOF|nr:myosin-binding protein 7-like [Zingiber officinale]KAG6503977.1 hypothetical protein ZIOFF_036301 [Zingiber officinale]